ncbi:putative RING-H2 finger protein ATL35 isoform X2 [Capsella rubella]|uniref:putative RING-H2 finger protein ATL35 isoform X2 n=1 Tax=Capsella rubella TaxID=81985 RepID=UPI000CD49DD1|nr:putative RING-H2 finger protein ATL35 isoform X2 [Capsella rubella]
MNTFPRGLIHRMVSSIVLTLLLLFFLPNVTCQQELESVDRNRKSNFSAESIIAIVLLATFMSLSMVACCFHKHNTFYSVEIETAGHEVLHNRARRGLEKEVIESFPSFLYSEVKGVKIGKGGVECAICLSEFEDQERLRWLPPCSHTFHANCIDVWLASRSTCPVCRANMSLKSGENFTYLNMDVEVGNVQRDIFFPRSHSTGHSLVQLCENLDRFTLQLPEELQRQLVSLNLVRRSHMNLPQAMSSRQGYRSGFISGRQRLQRAISMSLSFSIQPASVLSTHDRSGKVQETSQDKDNNLGERSFERLMPEKV